VLARPTSGTAKLNFAKVVPPGVPICITEPDKCLGDNAEVSVDRYGCGLSVVLDTNRPTMSMERNEPYNPYVRIYASCVASLQIHKDQRYFCQDITVLGPAPLPVLNRSTPGPSRFTIARLYVTKVDAILRREEINF